MRMWAHRLFRVGIVPVVVIAGMSVEWRVLEPVHHAPSTGASQQNPAVPPAVTKTPHGHLLPVVHQTQGSPGIQLAATQQPSPGPEITPKAPGGHVAPSTQPTAPSTPAPSPQLTPTPTGTCLVRVLTIGVCLGDN